MRLPARAGLLVLALAPLALAQDAPDPFLAERILPAHPLVFLSVPRSGSIAQDYAKSNLAKLVNHPEIQSFTAPLEAWVKKRKTQPAPPGGRPAPSLNDQAKGMTGLTVDEILELLQGPLALALYDVPVNEQHKLDLVLTLGAPDTAKLEKSLGAVKEALKQQGNPKEGEYGRAGTTIHEFGDDSFRLYYAMIQKTLVIATRQERMEEIADGSADKNFAGLREDAPFKAARARVAPENRHFFLLYANLAQTFRQYRRELGDEMLRAFETLGVADISSLAMSMGYDGPHIRERYALMTTRQDRGLLKLLAGGTPADPYATLVPAGAISYSHSGFNLPEVYDTIRQAAKLSPDFERGLQETLGEYEKRAGFQIREALASLGSSWTSWSWMPEGGGILPDSVTAIALNDPAGFESAIAKAAASGGFPLEETTFRGRTIRYITFGMEQMFNGVPAPVPDFFTFSTTISYLVQDKTLFLATHPMSLKRLLLRGAGGKSILDDPKYASVAGRLPPGDWDSRLYFDFGRIIVIGYGIIEPLLHLVRDMARDENGELILDLARLPLEETLAELLGVSLTCKRTLDDAILVESRSNTGVSSSSGIGIAAIVAAIAIPTAMRMSGHGAMGGVAQNEMIAEVSLQFIRTAEETFKNSDSDANGVADYWTRDVAGLHFLKDRSGQAIFLIDPATAAADPDGAARYGLTAAPKNGYFFKMMVSDQEGGVYQKDDGKTNKARYGVCAYPAAPGATGRFTFITNESGKTWKKDTQGKPVDKWPGKDPSQEGWALAE